jgi:hypothetical protein
MHLIESICLGFLTYTRSSAVEFLPKAVMLIQYRYDFLGNVLVGRPSPAMVLLFSFLLSLSMSIGNFLSIASGAGAILTRPAVNITVGFTVSRRHASERRRALRWPACVRLMPRRFIEFMSMYDVQQGWVSVWRSR